MTHTLRPALNGIIAPDGMTVRMYEALDELRVAEYWDGPGQPLRVLKCDRRTLNALLRRGWVLQLTATEYTLTDEGAWVVRV